MKVGICVILRLALLMLFCLLAVNYVYIRPAAPPHVMAAYSEARAIRNVPLTQPTQAFPVKNMASVDDELSQTQASQDDNKVSPASVTRNSIIITGLHKDSSQTTTISSVSNMTLESILDSMKTRTIDISARCAGGEYYGKKQPPYKFIVSHRSSKLLYCPVPKSGWSTWKLLLYREAGVENYVNDLTKTGFQSEWWRAGLQVVKSTNVKDEHYDQMLVFVRDPYDRLVSGYSDKALTNNGAYVKTQKRPCTHISISKKSAETLSFPQFVECILKNAAQGHRSLADYGAGSSLDIHWRPQTLLCDFCHRNYTIIGHMETMSQDLVVALTQLGMETKTSHSNASSRKRDRPLSYWYDQLTSVQKKGLQQLYGHDFQLLGYSSNIPTQP